MVRLCTILLLAAVGSAWASAQGPTTGDRRGLLQKNQLLLAELVDQTVELAAADNNPLAQAKVCRRTTAALCQELKRAADADDADRVAEVSEYLAVSVTDGLAPTLSEARRNIPAGSDTTELTTLHTAAVGETTAATGSIRYVGKVGQSQLVKDARAKLADAQTKLADAVR